MKTMKKAAALGLAIIMTAGLTACGGSATKETQAAAAETTAQTEAASEAAATEAPAAEGETYTVGICQLVQHVALDAATQGFKDAITEQLGDSVEFIDQNAQGDSNTCSTIINDFVAKEVDLILANATAPLQAAAAGTNEIPILGTSVTDYATALEISDWSGTVGGNISGTTDLAPLDGQAAMLQELFPDAKNVGLLYCSAEANSEYQITVIEEALTGMGYACERYAFTDTNDIATIVQNAVSASDVIYVPTDNAAASNTEIINNICEPAGIPVVAGEEGICAGCGVATLSISYYDLGYATGKMAVEILQGGDISTMPVQSAPNFTKKYVASRCETLGVTIPDDYEAVEE